MQVKLVVVSGSTKHQQIKLRLPTVIGRGRTCTLQLPHPLVSRQHCEIYEEGGRLKVRDLGSLNGTFVSGQKVTTSDLPPGCQLGVGTVTFRVEYEASEKIPVDAMPPGWTKGAKPASGQAPAAASTPTAAVPAAASPAVASPAAPGAPVAGPAPVAPMAGRVAAPIAAPVASAIPVAGPVAPIAAPVAQPVGGFNVPTAGIPVAGAPTAGQPIAGQPVAGSPAAGTPIAGVPVAGVPITNAPAAGATGHAATSPEMFEPLADFAEELDASANATRIPSASMPIEPVPIAPMNEDFDLGADFGGEGHEDAVEVVENPSDLLPPAAVKAWLPQAGAPQAGQPAPGPSPAQAPGQASSGKPMPSNTPTEDDDDITAFLRSLKK